MNASAGSRLADATYHDAVGGECTGGEARCWGDNNTICTANMEYAAPLVQDGWNCSLQPLAPTAPPAKASGVDDSTLTALLVLLVVGAFLLLVGLAVWSCVQMSREAEWGRDHQDAPIQVSFDENGLPRIKIEIPKLEPRTLLMKCCFPWLVGSQSSEENTAAKQEAHKKSRVPGHHRQRKKWEVQQIAVKPAKSPPPEEADEERGGADGGEPSGGAAHERQWPSSPWPSPSGQPFNHLSTPSSVCTGQILVQSVWSPSKFDDRSLSPRRYGSASPHRSDSATPGSASVVGAPRRGFSPNPSASTLRYSASLSPSGALHDTRLLRGIAFGDFGPASPAARLPRQPVRLQRTGPPPRPMHFGRRD